jgi:hypothetical protein
MLHGVCVKTWAAVLVDIWPRSSINVALLKFSNFVMQSFDSHRAPVTMVTIVTTTKGRAIEQCHRPPTSLDPKATVAKAADRSQYTNNNAWNIVTASPG